MESLVLVTVLGLAILGGGLIAQRLRLPLPLVLLVFGTALGFAPFLSEIELPPELVLLLFLPALLYWESLNTSLREIKANARVIVLISVVLVFVTAIAVALIGRWFGLSWPMALALGAILSPTDASAVATSIGRLPRRTDTILRAESLLNDGTALVLYAVAVGAAVSGREITVGDVSVRFLASYALGALIGFAIGLATIGLRKVIGPSRLPNSTLSVLTPFLAYLPAEAIGVSGVVAVVICGLVVSQYAPRVVTAATRAQTFGFWQLTTYLLTGALFVLIGLELHPLLKDLGGDWPDALSLGLLCAITVIGVRLIWGNTTPYLIRLLDRRPVQRSLRVGFRQRFPISWAGFRGAVSLAAALALPTQTLGGAPLAGRDVVIGVTFVVILFTVTVQGLSMRAVVRWARLAPDPREFDEELLAEQTGLQASLEKLPGLAEQLGSPERAVHAVTHDLERRLRLIRREEGHPELAERLEDEVDAKSALLLALIPVKRTALIDLRSSSLIDDVIFRRVQARLDLEELRLSGLPEDE